jgi:hypothetical protein
MKTSKYLNNNACAIYFELTFLIDVASTVAKVDIRLLPSVMF